MAAYTMSITPSNLSEKKALVAADTLTITVDRSISAVRLVSEGGAAVYRRGAAPDATHGSPISDGLFVPVSAPPAIPMAGWTIHVDPSASVTFGAEAVDSAWGSVLSATGWERIYDQSLASVDTASATFSLGGVTWTKQNSGGGSLSSDGAGLTITPNASTTSTTAPAYTAPLSAFLAGYETATLMICMQRDAIDPGCPTPGAGYKSQCLGVGDEDGNPSGYSEYACNSTSPSGQGAQASRNGSSPVKVSASSSTIHWLCTRVADGIALTQYYGTSADLNPAVLTLIDGPYNVETINPGGTPLADQVRFYAARGNEAYSALFKRIVIYQWSP